MQVRAGRVRSTEWGSGHHTYRIGAEQRRSPGDSPDPTATLEDINRVEVVRVDDGSAAQRTEQLADPEDRDFSPWEAAEDGEGEGDGGVDVAARDAGGEPDTEGGATCPSEVE